MPIYMGYRVTVGPAIICDKKLEEQRNMVPPLYEYQCPNHGRFEAWQRITEPALDRCPECGQPIEKLISLPSGFVNEPSGHYVPAPGYDKKGRMNEIKISKRESERQDRARRDAMMATRERAIKQGQRPVFN